MKSTLNNFINTNHADQSFSTPMVIVPAAINQEIESNLDLTGWYQSSIS